MRYVLLLGSPLRSGVVTHLMAEGLPPAAVVTPAGKALQPMRDSLAAACTIPVEACRKADIAARLRDLAPEVVVCLGWPYLFDAAMVDGPWLLLNTHPTLLPKYRGINPWYYIIANRESAIGVTVHKIDRGMDSGPILHQVSIPLGRFDTYRSLRSKLVALEPSVVAEALHMVRAGSASFVEQDEAQASTFREQRGPQDSRLDPSKSLLELFDHIRACDPDSFPAHFTIDGEQINIRLWRADRGDDHPESL